MKKTLIMLFAFTLLAVSVRADENIPLCKLGNRPINTVRKTTPNEATRTFTAKKGSVVHMEESTPGSAQIRWVRCRLAEDVESYVMSGIAWDVKSGNSFTTEEWDLPSLTMPPTPVQEGLTREEMLAAIREATRVSEPPEFDNIPDHGLCGSSWRSGRRWGCVAVAAIVVGVAANHGGGNEKKEKLSTLPPCTQLPCN